MVVSTHVHNEDSRGVKFLDNPLGRDADSRHKESSLLLHGQTKGAVKRSVDCVARGARLVVLDPLQ